MAATEVIGGKNVGNTTTTVCRRYRLIGLESGSFLLRHYKITQRWAKVFPKALVERNSVMVEVFYMILISQKYDQKPTILKG